MVIDRRKQQKDDTRKRLTAAAIELLSRKGWAGTTVGDIARKAGVAKGTFFFHFASKDEIVTGLVRAQVTAARRARERVLAAGGSPVDALRAAVFELGAQAARSRELSRAVVAGTVEARSSWPTCARPGARGCSRSAPTRSCSRGR